MLLPEALLKTSLFKRTFRGVSIRTCLETQWTPVWSTAIHQTHSGHWLGFGPQWLIIIPSPYVKPKRALSQEHHPLSARGFFLLSACSFGKIWIQPMPTYSEIQTPWFHQWPPARGPEMSRLRRASMASICVSEKSDSDGAGATISSLPVEGTSLGPLL